MKSIVAVPGGEDAAGAGGPFFISLLFFHFFQDFRFCPFLIKLI